MSIEPDRYRPKLGEQGERCGGCGVPLAEDQRYCLNCGRRRANARIPFLDVLHEEWESKRATQAQAAAEEAIEAAVAERMAGAQQRNWSPLVSAAAGGLIALILGIGFVIGQSGDDDGGAPQASTPPVIQVGDGGGGGTANAAAFTSDWPADQAGWTVQLQTLPKDATQPAAVASAKTAAEGKGASEVGALDADGFDGLEAAGNYVIYSGVFAEEKDAKARLKELKGDFPDAKVIEIGSTGSLASDKSSDDDLSEDDEGAVSKDDLNALQGLSPEDYAKQSRKLPDETVLPGKPPPVDDKPAGGGSEVETIE